MFAPFEQALIHDPEARLWYRYVEPVAAYACADHTGVKEILGRAERAVEAEGLYAVGFVGYEAARAFDPEFAAHQPGDLPLAAFSLYRRRERFEVRAAQGEALHWRESETESRYRSQFAELKARIGAGDVYQVNYTTRLTSHCADPYRLFQSIARDARYGAYIEHADFAVVSASPELFFRLDGTSIVSMPMKGTRPRGNTPAADRDAGEALRTSSKDRAENLMITDMVRNDLGRIAAVGSVRVPELFKVTPFPRVWQMTSTVTAHTDAGLVTLFAALFPAASITGAPKHASMQLIKDSEPAPRELYTGAIGVLAPGRRYQFNVAIRTAWVERNAFAAVYGVGGGIVWDSAADAELAERRDKAAILAPLPAFDLLETMRVEDCQVLSVQAHLSRLGQSAAYFGYAFDEARTAALLQEAASALSQGVFRLRMTLNAQGDVQTKAAPLPQNPAWQPVALAAHPVTSDELLLYHKTTHRKVYEDAAAQVPPECEALLFNEHGKVTESAIANIVYELNGRRYTPPVSDGLLPGTLRGALVVAGELEERSLGLDELGRVDALYLINALRGWRRAELVSS